LRQVVVDDETVALRLLVDRRDELGRSRTDLVNRTPMEAIRALKHRLSHVVYQHMLRDATTATRTSPGGQKGATLQSSAADPNPEADTSEQSPPGPADHHPRTPNSDAA
jgi:hypothetical protein